MAQPEIDESSKKPPKGRKGAAKSSKAPSKPRFKKQTKSSQVASQQAGMDADVAVETNTASTPNIGDWSRTKPGVKHADTKPSTCDPEAVHDVVEIETIPEVHVSIQRAKRKLDAFLFSDSAPADPEQITIAGAQELIQEEAVRGSPAVQSMMDDVPSAAYTEHELYGDFWQNDVLAEGDIPDYEVDVPEYAASAVVDNRSSMDVDRVEEIVEMSSGPASEDLQDVYEATVNLSGAPVEGKEDAPITGAHDYAEADAPLTAPFEDELEDELEDDAFKDIVIDEAMPDVEQQSVNTTNNPLTQLNLLKAHPWMSLLKHLSIVPTLVNKKSSTTLPCLISNSTKTIHG